MRDPPFFESRRRLRLVVDSAAFGPEDAGSNVRVTGFLRTLNERWIFRIPSSRLFNIRSIRTPSSTLLPVLRVSPKIGRFSMGMNTRVNDRPGGRRECQRRAVYIYFSLFFAMALSLPRARRGAKWQRGRRCSLYRVSCDGRQRCAKDRRQGSVEQSCLSRTLHTDAACNRGHTQHACTRR